MFSTRVGTPHSTHNIRKRVLKPAVESVGLDWVGFHTFRHTCASLLFAGGKEAKQVQEWLGHADPGYQSSDGLQNVSRPRAVRSVEQRIEILERFLCDLGAGPARRHPSEPINEHMRLERAHQPVRGPRSSSKRPCSPALFCGASAAADR